jgi:stage V sporulation protein AF
VAIESRLQDNLDLLREKLGIGESFDIIAREFSVGGKDAALIFVDGLIKDKVTLDIISSLQNAPRQEIVPCTVAKLLAHHIPYFETDIVDSLEQVVDQVLAGPAVLLIDGEDQAIAIDVREYPVRAVEEPDLERVTRGAHEGLVETVVFNTAMIRRRVRDPGLRFEMITVGTRSKTDVAVGYIQDVVDQNSVRLLKSKIEGIQADALIMGAKSLEEYLFRQVFNPLPRVRYTERPDVAAAHLLEGHILVLTDTTPMAMILPVTAFHFTQHAEEYFQAPLVGTYLRWVRALGVMLTLLLTPLWLALYLEKPELPAALQFIGPKEPSIVPVTGQLFILEIGLDLIRMALIHTPSALATSLGIVGAILLGDLAVQVGLFVPETILYTAISAIGYFAIPSIEFGLAVRIFRYVLLLGAALLHLPGLLIALGLIFLLACSTRSLNVPYLWPLCPPAWGPLIRLLFRYPIPEMRRRPPFAGQDRKEASE